MHFLIQSVLSLYVLRFLANMVLVFVLITLVYRYYLQGTMNLLFIHKEFTGEGLTKGGA